MVELPQLSRLYNIVAVANFLQCYRDTYTFRKWTNVLHLRKQTTAKYVNIYLTHMFPISTRKLEMYPKGDKGGEGHLSFYLTATDYVTNLPKGPTLAVYKLRLLDQLKRNHKEPGTYT